MKIERWQTFQKRDQLLHIGAAILRASHWQGKDDKLFRLSLEEALKLADLCIQDNKWQDELEKFSSDERQENVKILYQAF